ncbi:uncharacterized protein LOC109813342 [Cajanus cajan]|uniref:uncharacterized protein LOC109813342 n=1 Tax=Cajanus cajan TaxID=3821 RepID=UPI00098DA7F3|nr:uncharacterized protein LOC109813342 [Cajanus cajan]
MSPPPGTIVFNTVGRPQYGFDVFSVDLHHHHPPPHAATDHRLTDAISVNFNAQFINNQNDVVFVSERTGSPRFYITRPDNKKPQPLPFLPKALFHDRPIIKNDNLYFVSTLHQHDAVFTNFSAVYSSAVNDAASVTRLTPRGEVDYSPAVSLTGKFLAVASYRSRPWQTDDFRELQTEIVVFPESDPGNRVTVSERGGWPTWSRDSTIFFHRIAEDGWWSIFRVDFTDFDLSESRNSPVRVTPPGLHCFTPSAFHDGKRIAVATRRKESSFRHVEIFDLESETFQRVTETINPNFHHYNPFVSLDSRHLGYHRFRGESTQGESTYPHLDKIVSPVHDLQLLRLNGSFPSFSPDGDFIAFNHDLDGNRNGGVKIISSNGSKRWTLLKGRTCFHNAWSPTEKNVIFTSVGPIFESVYKTVQIARIEFDPAHLTNDREEVPFKLTILTKEETGNNAFPSCSPDGKSIVFRSGRSGQKNLYVVDAVKGECEGEIRRLTEGAWIDTMPCWSPKGDLIAFSSNRHEAKNSEVFGIYLVRPDGSGLRRVEVAKGEEGAKERLNHVCFSRDGEWLLFTANLGGLCGEPVGLPNQFQPYGDLYVVRVDGSGLRRLTCNAYENGTPTWHPGDLAAGDYGGAQDWDKVEGDFQEPLWITCAI